MKAHTLRVGTRQSKLALYQANLVKKAIEAHGVKTEIVEIASEGDIDLVTPLYEMGIQGIFTRSLDAALLQNKIDVAVHSAKDIPTKLARGLGLHAVLKRGSAFDCLVLPAGKTTFNEKEACTIASSSLRRRSQWLHRYGHHTMENLRGNIQTRLERLDQNGWQGAIFAAAALERLNIQSHHYITLDWMVPAPAQGAIAVVGREDDVFVKEACQMIHHEETGLCIEAERDFLATLHGGCAVPIAAHVFFENDQFKFKGNIFSLDAHSKCEVEMIFPATQVHEAGMLAAQEILRKGGAAIIKTFRPEF